MIVMVVVSITAYSSITMMHFDCTVTAVAILVLTAVVVVMCYRCYVLLSDISFC